MDIILVSHLKDLIEPTDCTYYQSNTANIFLKQPSVIRNILVKKLNLL